MTPDRVDAMLAQYREYSARCAYLESRMDLLTKQLKSREGAALEDAALGGGVNYDGMPHGTSVGNPVERIACMFADGYVSEDIKLMQWELDELGREYREKSIVVIFVDAWMRALTPKEQLVIRSKVFDALSWKEIAYACNKEFGRVYSRHGLIRIRNEAMEKIYKIAE